MMPGGKRPGAIAFNSEPGDGSPGSPGNGGNGNGGGNTGGDIGPIGAGGVGGRSRPPTRFPIAGMADPMAGRSAASGPKP